MSEIICDKNPKRDVHCWHPKTYYGGPMKDTCCWCGLEQETHGPYNNEFPRSRQIPPQWQGNS